MRLRRLFALPWLILALLLQAGAPAQAAGMAAAMLADPAMSMDAMPGMAMPAMGAMYMPMCGDKAHRPARPEPQKDCCAGCPICAVAHAVAPLAHAVVVPMPRPRAAVVLARTQAHAPRGPPSIVPRARGPPILT